MKCFGKINKNYVSLRTVVVVKIQASNKFGKLSFTQVVFPESTLVGTKEFESVEISHHIAALNVLHEFSRRASE